MGQMRKSVCAAKFGVVIPRAGKLHGNFRLRRRRCDFRSCKWNRTRRHAFKNIPGHASAHQRFPEHETYSTAPETIRRDYLFDLWFVHFVERIDETLRLCFMPSKR